MKKISLFSLFIVFGFRVLADATISIDNYFADKPIYFYDQTPCSFDVFCELLANGKSIKKFIIPKGNNGYFDEGVVTIPGIPDRTIVQFTFRIWTKGESFPGSEFATQASWSQATGSSNPTTIPPTPPEGPSLNFGSFGGYFRFLDREYSYSNRHPCSINIDTNAALKIRISWIKGWNWCDYAVFAADKIGGPYIMVMEVPLLTNMLYESGKAYEFRDPTQTNYRQRFYIVKQRFYYP